jgi:ATP-dependent Clp protease ATP-binding subunit ClpA
MVKMAFVLILCMLLNSSAMAGNRYFRDLLAKETRFKSPPVRIYAEELNQLVGSLKAGKNIVLTDDTNLASSIIIGEFAELLSSDRATRGTRFLQLDVRTIQMESKNSTELRKKFSAVLNRVDSKTILFIDQIHTVLSANLSDILLNKIKRRKILCIGTSNKVQFSALRSAEKEFFEEIRVGSDEETATFISSPSPAQSPSPLLLYSTL